RPRGDEQRLHGGAPDPRRDLQQQLPALRPQPEHGFDDRRRGRAPHRAPARVPRRRAPVAGHVAGHPVALTGYVMRDMNAPLPVRPRRFVMDVPTRPVPVRAGAAIALLAGVLVFAAPAASSTRGPLSSSPSAAV